MVSGDVPDGGLDSGGPSDSFGVELDDVKRGLEDPSSARKSSLHA